MPPPASAPIALVARIAYDDEQIARLKEGGDRRGTKAALQAVHDEMAARIVPRLAALRDGGAVIDYATSWLLAEVVVHARPGRIDEAISGLEAIPELRDVGAAALRRAKRR